MDLTLTYNELLNFPDEFLKESSKYYEVSELISKTECDKYNTKELKEKVEARFKKFKDARYIYKYPNEKYYQPITPNYQIHESMMTRNISNSRTGKIDSIMDKQVWVTKLYYSLMDTVTTKLTKQEAVYLIDSFFKNVSEEIIADKLSVCRQTLQKIKKSCLVKVWIEMEALEEFEDL